MTCDHPNHDADDHDCTPFRTECVGIADYRAVLLDIVTAMETDDDYLAHVAFRAAKKMLEGDPR